MSSTIKRVRAFLKRNEAIKGLLLVGIVLLAAVSIWAGVRLALNTEYPVLVVSSPSMVPTLMVGDLIVIRGQPASTIVAGPPPIGSIIVFRPPCCSYNVNDPNYLVVHRVVRMGTPGVCGNPQCFITVGDNNHGAEDPWDVEGVPPNKVVGVYQYTIPVPYLGTSILAIRSFMYDDTTGQPKPQGLAVILVLVIALFAFEVIEPSTKKKSAPSPPSSSGTPVQETPKVQPDVPPAGIDVENAPFRGRLI
ncbi:signal peptidase I [Candidatus Bathyarchaeota archaeon]|nr:MAG: signal peptidase I [Candidatus Bathyarchaeota archaeon]TMI30982.1 MAG: signal peptidase I [Candidatus Bathyarchaeota archaeon]